MKRFTKILFLLLISFCAKSQAPSPSGFASPYSTAYYRIGWMQTDSGFINASMDTSVRSRFAGLQFMWSHPGVDTSLWFFNGGRYTKIINTQDTLPGRFLVTKSFLSNQAYLNNITGYIQQGSNVTISGLGTFLSPYVINSSGGGGSTFNQDSIKHLFVDTSANRNGYVLAFDSTLHKWYLSPNGTGTGITGLTGDGTASGSGIVPFTLSTVNSNVGTFGSASSVAQFTTNAKGLTTAASSVAIQIGESQVTNLTTDLAGKQAALSGTGYLKFSGTTPSYLTPTQVTADLNLFSTSLQGLAPASGGGTTNFLRADGTWAAPPGGGGSGTVTNVAIGNLSPLFTTIVSNPTTSASAAFTLSNAAANSILGNNTGSSAAPTYFVPTSTTLNNWFGGTILSNTLTSGNILVGGAGNTATSVTPSGDWTISNTGVATLKNTGVGAGTCTNCNVTFDAQGRETGYSSGSNVSSFWTPETFGAVADGVTDCTIPFQRAIDSAALTKGTVLLSKGVYLIRCSYRDTATVYKPSGLYLRTNVTIDGPGSGAVVKISAPPASSTFTQISAPLTWSTNTLFFSLFHLDTVSGVILRNFRIDGNIVNQINRFGFDAYKNPQDGTTTQNVQTNAIDLRGGSNNTIYNVRIDSVTGYGIRDSGSTNNNYNYITVTTTINGGVYYSFANVNGSILQNSLLTNSWCDNVRIRSSNVSVFNNEISFAKFNPNGNGGSNINFAGLYIESGAWGDVVGMNITGNYIHDNSAYGIDGNTTDTLRYTYPGQSALISNNVISFNGAGGVQVALPFMSVKGNNIFNNAATSAGIIDSSASQCFCSVHIGNSSIGAAIIGNDMRDTRKKQKNGGLNGTPIALLTFSGNTASGMSINNSAASSYSNTAPYNSVYGNSYIDTNNVIHNDFSTDGNGNLHIVPTSGQNGANVGNTYFGDGTNNAGIFGNYKTSGGTFAFVSQMAGVNEMRFDLNNAATYSGTGNATSGRQIIFADATNSINRVGIDQNGTLFVGTTGSSYALKVSQIGTDLATVNAGVEAVATGNGSTANIVQAAFKSVLNAGYTGSGYPMAAYFLNSTAGTGNSIAGAGAIKGNFGYYSGSNSATASGTNIGGFAYGSAGLRCVGLLGDATLSQANSASAVSIGVVGFGLRNNASAIHVGGYFGLQSTQPTFASAALIADNGATSDPVFLGRVNGTVKAQINSLGNGLFNILTDSLAFIHIGPGTATNAPLKLTAGTLLTTPKNGVIEFDGVNYYGTAGGTRTAFGGGGATNIGSTQNALNYSLTSSTGTGTTLLTATSSLAGLLDTARTKFIDSLKNGLKTFTLKAANGLFAPTIDSILWGGTLNQNTTVANAGFLVTHSGTGYERFTSPLGAGTATSTDANYTVGSESFVKLVTITADRVATLPSASTYTGRFLTLTSYNTASFKWTTTPTMLDGNGSGLALGYLVNGATYGLYSDGTNWIMKSINYPISQGISAIWGASISSGSSSTMNDGLTGVLFDPGSAIATYTLTLPSHPPSGALVKIHFGGTITSGVVVTSLTISPNSGQTIIGTAVTTGVVGPAIIYIFDISTNRWYREQ